MKRLKANLVLGLEEWLKDVMEWTGKINDLNKSLEKMSQLYQNEETDENRKNFMSDLVKINNASAALHVACMNCINILNKEKE